MAGTRKKGRQAEADRQNGSAREGEKSNSALGRRCGLDHGGQNRALHVALCLFGRPHNAWCVLVEQACTLSRLDRAEARADRWGVSPLLSACRRCGDWDTAQPARARAASAQHAAFGRAEGQQNLWVPGNTRQEASIIAEAVAGSMAATISRKKNGVRVHHQILKFTRARYMIENAPGASAARRIAERRRWWMFSYPRTQARRRKKWATTTWMDGEKWPIAAAGNQRIVMAGKGRASRRRSQRARIVRPAS